MTKDELRREARKRAYEYEKNFHGCSQAVLLTLQELMDMGDDLSFRAASALCAGVGVGKTCGALTGGVMALSL